MPPSDSSERLSTVTLKCHTAPVGRCEKCRSDFPRRWWPWWPSMIFSIVFENCPVAWALAVSREVTSEPAVYKNYMLHMLHMLPMKPRQPAPSTWITWESHQVWSSVEEADSSSAPVALGLADRRIILSHLKRLKPHLKVI